jgi:ABC-type nitrate/sulfonate/bicarbonate transport system ATPase subunit
MPSGDHGSFPAACRRSHFARSSANPSILLMDELSSALDAITRRGASSCSSWERYRKTVLFVTRHSRRHATADRVLVAGRNPSSIIAG